MNACRFFLLTSLAFPYIKKSFQYQPLNSQSAVVHMEEGKEKPAMANLFFHLLIPNQKECRAVLKFVLFGAVQQDCLHPALFNWLLDSSSVRTLAICQCLPAPPLCLLNILLHVQSDLGLQFFRHVSVIPCSCHSFCFILHLQCKSLCQTSQH